MSTSLTTVLPPLFQYTDSDNLIPDVYIVELAPTDQLGMTVTDSDNLLFNRSRDTLNKLRVKIITHDKWNDDFTPFASATSVFLSDEYSEEPNDNNEIENSVVLSTQLEEVEEKDSDELNEELLPEEEQLALVDTLNEAIWKYQLTTLIPKALGVSSTSIAYEYMHVLDTDTGIVIAYVFNSNNSAIVKRYIIAEDADTLDKIVGMFNIVSVKGLFTLLIDENVPYIPVRGRATKLINAALRSESVAGVGIDAINFKDTLLSGFRLKRQPLLLLHFDMSDSIFNIKNLATIRNEKTNLWSIGGTYSEEDTVHMLDFMEQYLFNNVFEYHVAAADQPRLLSKLPVLKALGEVA